MNNNKDLNIIKQFESADNEEFKRPHHTDFMTSSELKQTKFSGVRINELSQEQELWIQGEVKIHLPLLHENFREVWNALYAEAFALHPGSVETVESKGN